MVVDDEPLAAQLLGDYVRQTPFLSLEGICSSAVEAFSMWQEHPADLLFLDIQMPQMNGLELSRTLGERSRVIFTTAFEQYALEGFRADALDYLLKPISYAEFLRAAGKARRWFEAGTTGTAPASPEAIPAARNLFVRTDYKSQQIRLDDILYIEGMKDYVLIIWLRRQLVTQHEHESDRAVAASGPFRAGTPLVYRSDRPGENDRAQPHRLRQDIYPGLGIVQGTLHGGPFPTVASAITNRTKINLSSIATRSLLSGSFPISPTCNSLNGLA